jgi:hypothetical protein
VPGWKSKAADIAATTVLRSRAAATRAVLHRILRQAGSPLLIELYSRAEPWCLTADEFVAALDPNAVSLVDEARRVTQEVRGVRVERQYPTYYESENETLVALYAFVRSRSAPTVVETGVADGYSSEIILRAGGSLHSLDIADNVGGVVSDRSSWDLRIDREPDALARLLHDVGAPDVFFHDSDHRYGPQTSEYRAAWSALAPGGVFLSADIDYSFAFLDFADGDVPMLLDRRNVTGGMRKYQVAVA